MEVKLSFEERNDFTLKRWDESVVSANIVAWALLSSASEILIFAGKEDLLELVVGKDSISVTVEVRD